MTTENGAQLRSYVERIENRNEAKKEVQEEIKEIFAEAKGNGYDTKIIREVIKRRAKDRAELDEEQSLIEMYEEAIARGRGE